LIGLGGLWLPGLVLVLLVRVLLVRVLLVLQSQLILWVLWQLVRAKD
jgi:hypothetical protein